MFKAVMVGISAAALAVTMTTGCVTSRQQTVTNGVTNTVVVVNQANLDLDCAIVSTATAVGVTVTLNSTHNDANVIAALHNAATALGGILNGTNPQTTDQVVQILKAQGNPAVAQQVTALVQSLSAVEQQLLNKYGQGVAGQVSVALTKAVYAGLTTGLTGH